MIAGVLLSSVVIGQIISRTGKWKRYMVLGSVLLTIGLALMGTIRYDTPTPRVPWSRSSAASAAPPA